MHYGSGQDIKSALAIFTPLLLWVAQWNGTSEYSQRRQRNSFCEGCAKRLGRNSPFWLLFGEAKSDREMIKARLSRTDRYF
jgi:hypothetical protein